MIGCDSDPVALFLIQTLRTVKLFPADALLITVPVGFFDPQAAVKTPKVTKPSSSIFFISFLLQDLLLRSGLTVSCDYLFPNLTHADSTFLEVVCHQCFSNTDAAVLAML